ncbi:MAG: hypothetical protein KatS3mg104_0502 [Phycisphaerae bacterium]|jgi:hypothetical protein|nr:MAG: hypothetical protein KatS3mg104_0502 [Phycisphaerae bacterium]
MGILIGSGLMLHQLCRRHTVGRDRFAVWEWSVNRRFKRVRSVSPVGVEGLEVIEQTVRVIEHYQSRDSDRSILKIQSLSRSGTLRTWHVLIQETDGLTGPVGLRPVGSDASLVDLMNLPLMPRVSNETRFAVYALRVTDARRVATGAVKALLPPDIGLIRSSDRLILDFTARPFDPTEFDRILAIAGQIRTVLS